MPSKIYLTAILEPDPDAAVFEYAGTLPAFRGQDHHENLACPGCKDVIGRSISTATIHDRFVTRKQLAFHCPCGTYSLLPARIDPDAG